MARCQPFATNPGDEVSLVLPPPGLHVVSLHVARDRPLLVVVEDRGGLTAHRHSVDPVAGSRLELLGPGGLVAGPT